MKGGYKMLEEEFSYLINQFGVSIFVNDDTQSRQAIISSQNQSDQLPTFDDKKIHCSFQIKRGDIIHFNEVKYLIISDVQSKRSFEYKATIRPMTNIFEYTYMTEGVILEYDRNGNPIYVEGEEPKEITINIPCIAVQNNTPKIDGGQIATLENRITVIVSDNSITQQIAINDEYYLENHYYMVHDINLLQQGIRLLYLEWTVEPA